MKRLLLLLVILIAISTQAREVVSPKDLQVGDSFSLRVSIPAEGAKFSSPWDFYSGHQIDFDFKVLSLDGDSIEVAVEPTRYFVCYQDSLYADAYAYTDTYFFGYYDLDGKKSHFHRYENNTVIAHIAKKDGIVAVAYYPNDNCENCLREWDKSVPVFPKGLNALYNYLEQSKYNINIGETIKHTLGRFYNSWKNQSVMPQLIDLRSEPQSNGLSPSFVEIYSASFNLRPNVSVTFTAPKHIPEDRIFISLEDQKIKPLKKEGDIYFFNFFISSPSRVSIQDVLLDITPSDSICVSFDEQAQVYLFEGKGAANSAYINSISKLYTNSLPEMSAKADSASNFKFGAEYYKSVLSRYSKDMNSYWLKSAELAQDYWFVSEHFKQYNAKTKKFYLDMSVKEITIPSKNEIPWDNEHFKNLFPAADYRYQPYMYGDFLKDFLLYKKLQSTDDAISRRGFPFLYWSDYYFADIILSGYPRSYLTSEILKEIMVILNLNKSQKEYEDFLIKDDHEPIIRESVINLYDQLMKVEPGANIKNLNLEVEKYIPLKNKSDHYIILLVTDSLDNNEADPFFASRYKEIFNQGYPIDLEGKFEACIITAESRKKYFGANPKMKEKIIFVPDRMIRDYTDKVLSPKGSYLLIRSDGMILHSRLDCKSLRFPIIQMFNKIMEDFESQKNQSSTSSGVLVVIITSLISIGLTFLIVRYFIRRRERTKQHILQLELKAIRAQINPHFTFNALGSIQNLIAQKKDKEANDYLVNFAKLLRMVLSTSEKKLVSLSEEVELLNLYLRLEQLRVPFNYTINIAPNVDQANEEIPGMLIQPIVENAVKHGIVPKGEGQIALNFSMGNQTLLVEVIDSGSGFAETETQSGKGFGLRSVQERLSLLRREHHLNIEMKTENLMEDGMIKGAKVTLEIPV